MSAGATPSDLMSDTSALAAFAFAAIASPAVFPVFVSFFAERHQVSARGADAFALHLNQGHCRCRLESWPSAGG